MALRGFRPGSITGSIWRAGTEAALLANFSQGVRRNIRKAEKAGVEVKVVGEEALDDFVRIMQVTGERDGFSTRPRSYFVKFLRGLGENVRLYAGYYQGKMISGSGLHQLCRQDLLCLRRFGQQRPGGHAQLSDAVGDDPLGSGNRLYCL